ncbi:MAG: hypothetical protein WD648_11085 [Planctomycetaceae bacterium]
MADTNGAVDVIKELRLRRWARGHYLPAEQRGNTWHLIVLDEMRRRDAELQAEQAEVRAAQQTGIFAYVPLMPDSIRRLHPSHAGFADPQILHCAVEVEQSIEVFIDLR